MKSSISNIKKFFNNGKTKKLKGKLKINIISISGAMEKICHHVEILMDEHERLEKAVEKIMEGIRTLELSFDVMSEFMETEEHIQSKEFKEEHIQSKEFKEGSLSSLEILRMDFSAIS